MYASNVDRKWASPQLTEYIIRNLHTVLFVPTSLSKAILYILFDTFYHSSGVEAPKEYVDAFAVGGARSLRLVLRWRLYS